MQMWLLAVNQVIFSKGAIILLKIWEVICGNCLLWCYHKMKYPQILGIKKAQKYIYK